MRKIIIMLLAAVLAVSLNTNAAQSSKNLQTTKRAYKHISKKVKSTQQLAKAAVLSGSTETLLYDITHERVLHGNIDNSPMSIASISKLMTVYTVIKDNQSRSEILTVPKASLNHTFLRSGMKVSRGDLIQLALVSSDNVAAHTLAINSYNGYDNFISRMNEHAQRLGMMNTKFVEPTGLSASNQSSIKDLIILTQAVQHIPEVRQAARSNNVYIESSFKNRIVKIKGTSTNKMFGQDGVQVIKTGFTNAAGFCIAMIVEKNNNLYNIIILGSKSKYERERIVNQMLSNVI